MPAAVARAGPKVRGGLHDARVEGPIYFGSMTLDRNSACPGRRPTSPLALLLSTAVLLVACAVPATSAAAVPAAEYAVTFVGTASEQVSWEHLEESTDDRSGHEIGTWQLHDGAADLWLPDAYGSEIEGYAEGSDVEQGPATDPASIEYEEGGQRCPIVSVGDRGTAVVIAGLTLGSLQITTSFIGAGNFPSPAPRSFQVPGDDTECGGGAINLFFPPERGADPTRDGQIAYVGTVPFADVGEGSFTVPATDGGTVDSAPWWGEQLNLDGEQIFTAHSLQIGGTYTFTKLCDGTISYPEGEGSCSGGGTPGGGTPGGGPPPSQPPSPGPVVGAAPGPSKRKPPKCRKGFTKKKVHGKARCVKKGRHHRKKKHHAR